MKLARWTLLASLLASVFTLPAIASTTCTFGGAAPGFRVARLALPSGSSFVNLELPAKRPTHVVDQGSSWHLAQGILIVRADTLAIAAYRISSSGTAPSHVVVRADGTTAADSAVPGPDGAFSHDRTGPTPGLSAGTYYAIGFGTGGGSSPPDRWTASISVSVPVDCSAVAIGETFDFNQTDFSGGTQAYAPGVGYADSISLAYSPSRTLFAGLIDANVQAAGNASLDYTTPSASGHIVRQVVPFVSVGGASTFTGAYEGPEPVLAIAGAAFDV